MNNIYEAFLLPAKCFICISTEQNSRKKSSDGWLTTVLAKGTSADRMAALIVLVQEAPIHNVHYLDTLIATLKKDHRKSLNVLG